MKIDGVKVTIGIDTLMKFFKKKQPPRKVQVGELIEVFGVRYRVYDADDEGFKAYEEKRNEQGMAV